MTHDRILVVLLMLAGALWLRQRARRLVPGQRKKALYGLLFFLLPALIGWQWVVERLALATMPKVSAELAGLAVIFAVMAFVFVRPEKEEKGT
jgi:polyferredoxin